MYSPVLLLPYIEKEQFKATLVFAVDQNHIVELVKEFEKACVVVRGLDGKTPSHMRKVIFRDFAEGRVDVLVNCGRSLLGVMGDTLILLI